MRAFDTHIHLDMLNDLGQQLEEAGKAGVSGWLVPGVMPTAWHKVLSITEQHNEVYAAPGVHPQAAGCCSKEQLDVLCSLMDHPKVVAIGEVGLDRQVATSREKQEEVFVRMIRLARETGKPLLIHSRKATGRIYDLLQQEDAHRVGGIFHAFSGSLETAQRIIDLGFVLGIGGVVTWPAAKRLPEVVRAVPAESLVLETDAPFMTPAPHRGQPNRVAYLALIAEKVAELRGWSVAETVRVTTKNAHRVLNLRPNGLQP